MSELFPAPAGMILQLAQATVGGYSFPRTRGDDPIECDFKVIDNTFSPHPRG